MTDAERELITRAALLERCLLLEDELAARRAVVAAANAHQAMTTTTSTGTTTATACKRCGQMILQGISHMCPDFDEPMEFVDSKRLRELEALEAAHQATCPNCGAPMKASTPAADPPTMPKLVRCEHCDCMVAPCKCGCGMPEGHDCSAFGHDHVAADPPSTAKDVLPHAGSIADPTFYDASGDRGVVPARPAPGQLTEAEREALAERLGHIPQAVDDARGPHDDQVIAPAPDANIANEPKRSGYMSKPKML